MIFSQKQSISPGAVKTELLTSAFNLNEVSEEVISQMPIMKGKDIADAVIYCLQTPPHVQV